MAQLDSVGDKAIQVVTVQIGMEMVGNQTRAVTQDCNGEERTLGRRSSLRLETRQPWLTYIGI